VVCRDCGDPEARASLDGVSVCDRCFDIRIAAHTGLPRLPGPPPPLALEGPDGRRHELRFRIWRGPAGIEVELEETGVPEGDGFHFAVLGDHDADVDVLIRRVTALAERAVARCQLGPADHRDG